MGDLDRLRPTPPLMRDRRVPARPRQEALHRSESVVASKATPIFRLTSFHTSVKRKTLPWTLIEPRVWIGTRCNESRAVELEDYFSDLYSLRVSRQLATPNVHGHSLLDRSAV